MKYINKSAFDKATLLATCVFKGYWMKWFLLVRISLSLNLVHWKAKKTLSEMVLYRGIKVPLEVELESTGFAMKPIIFSWLPDAFRAWGYRGNCCNCLEKSFHDLANWTGFCNSVSFLRVFPLHISLFIEILCFLKEKFHSDCSWRLNFSDCRVHIGLTHGW